MTTAVSPDLRAAYLRLVEERFGLRPSDHQARRLVETISELARRHGSGDPAALYQGLAEGRQRQALEELAATLTVGETHFFRVGPQIAALRQVVLPQLIARHANDRRLRIWSAGCASGEEPYTLAILLREALPVFDRWDVHLLATDVNRVALEAAQDARYGAWSFRDTPEEVRRRYFVADGKRWRLVDAVKDLVQFAYLNLATDPFPSPAALGPDLDLILCRNVTIYFSPEAGQRLYGRFADALVPDGWLVLGPSDPAPQHAGPFRPEFLPDAVLWRRGAAAAPVARPAPRARKPSLPPQRLVRPPASVARPDTAQPLEPPTEALEQVRALVRAGAVPAACERAQQLAQARPLDVQVHLLLGMLQLEAGAPEQARESLRRATFLEPSNPLAHFTLGRASALLGDRERARSALTQARRLLASFADDAAVAAADDMQAGALRHAVERQLEALQRPDAS